MRIGRGTKKQNALARLIRKEKPKNLSLSIY